MDDAIARLLRAAGTERCVAPFEPVLTEGADTNLLCLVHAGELLATVRIPGGEQVVAGYGPGSWFGAVGEAAPTTVTATRPCRVTVVEHDRLAELLEANRLAAGAIQARLDAARWERMRVLGNPGAT